MISKHTPGDWTVYFGSGPNLFVGIVDEFDICELSELGDPREESANALLIARAPKLLQTTITLSAKLRDMAKYAPTETTRKAVLEMCDEADNLVNR